MQNSPFVTKTGANRHTAIFQTSLEALRHIYMPKNVMPTRIRRTTRSQCTLKKETQLCAVKISMGSRIGREPQRSIVVVFFSMFPQKIPQRWPPLVILLPLANRLGSNDWFHHSYLIDGPAELHSTICSHWIMFNFVLLSARTAGRAPANCVRFSG